MKRKRIEYKQAISNGTKRAVIMPTFGTFSYKFRGKLGLPLSVMREVTKKGRLEPIADFNNRLINQFNRLEKKLVKLGGVPDDLWVKTYDHKLTIVDHDYVQPTKENPKGE